MAALPLHKRLAYTLAPLAVVGLGVVLATAWLAGSDGSIVALAAALIGLLIAVLAEANVALLGISRPLDRLLFTMLLRGGFSVIAIGVAIVAGGLDAQLVVLVALPIYLALLVGEAASAVRADRTQVGVGLGMNTSQGGV